MYFIKLLCVPINKYTSIYPCLCYFLKQPTDVGSPPMTLSSQGSWAELMLSHTAGHGRYCECNSLLISSKNALLSFNKFLSIHVINWYKLIIFCLPSLGISPVPEWL